MILSASGAKATMNTSELQKGGGADPLSPILDPNIVSVDKPTFKLLSVLPTKIYLQCFKLGSRIVHALRQ